MNSIVFIDVETPNGQNNRICSIGVVKTDLEGKIQSEYHYLINPEQTFNHINIRIHGIKPSQVIGKPTFDQIWNSELEQLFTDSLIVAHNATFDLKVIVKTLTAYELPTPEISYICTMKAAKRLLPSLENYKLPSLCEHLNLTLKNHHNALADARAAKNLFFMLMKNYGLTLAEAKKYGEKTKQNRRYMGSNRSQLMTDLHGIVKGISIDGIINTNEHTALLQWMEERKQEATEDLILKDAADTVAEILADNYVSDEERALLLTLTQEYLEDRHNSAGTVWHQLLVGILKGIAADRKVKDAEAQQLLKWIEKCENALVDQSIDSLIRELQVALKDEIIDAEEEEKLLKVFDRIINPMEGTDTAVTFTGKKFVLSGDFLFGCKDEVRAVIELRGGIVVKGVSGKVDYVVVGNEGSAMYAHGKYGSKVKKALDLQAKGSTIQVVTENDLNL